MTTVDPYDPPAAESLDVVADGWARELLRGVGDDVPPHLDEFDVGYQAVDTWHGGNPDPALAVIRQALLDVGAITRLRSSAIGALERRSARWAVQRGRELPKPLSENRIWEVTDVDRFEETMGRFNRYFRPLPADVRDRIISWASRPETNAGAPERGWLLDDTIDRLRHIAGSEEVSTETRARFLRWYNATYKGMYDDFAGQLWRWLNAEGALRKPTPAERTRLGLIPAGTRVWDRDRLSAALPEVTLER
ncbi:hypothetical protein [Curtobacterium sp. NPDC089689]|uniref:hypothetical protein n=1 Tax=Curtobacterium sp. NPDC089689 TaxID=3363968 RepID=UPI0038258E41